MDNIIEIFDEKIEKMIICEISRQQSGSNPVITKLFHHSLYQFIDEENLCSETVNCTISVSYYYSSSVRNRINNKFQK